jgi:hypothetical protein
MDKPAEFKIASTEEEIEINSWCTSSWRSFASAIVESADSSKSYSFE